MPSVSLFTNATVTNGGWTIAGAATGHQALDQDPDGSPILTQGMTDASTAGANATYELDDAPGDLVTATLLDLRTFGRCGTGTATPRYNVLLQNAAQSVTYCTVTVPEGGLDAVRTDDSGPVSLTLAEVNGLRVTLQSFDTLDAGGRSLFAVKVNVTYDTATSHKNMLLMGVG